MIWTMCGMVVYDKINLIGLSSDTCRFGLSAPTSEHVRSEILMGWLPPITNALNHARAEQRALGLLFDEFEADTGCNKTYPRLRQEFFELSPSLSRPSVVEYAVRRASYIKDLKAVSTKPSA